MIYIVEPTESYSLEEISSLLTSMNIPHTIEKEEYGNVIKADMTFDEVRDLKDKAYCTHMEDYDA